MRFWESWQLVARRTLVIVVMSPACTNVATDKGSEAQGGEVKQGNATVPAEASSDFEDPSTPAPALCEEPPCPGALLPGEDPAPSAAAASSPASDQKALQWTASEVASDCRLLLDDADSELAEQDVVMQYYPDVNDEANPVNVAWTPSDSCSPLDTLLVPLEGVPPTPTDAGSVLDASASHATDGGADGGTLVEFEAVDASAPVTAVMVPHLVDLAEEGAHLVHAVDGTWLELCPNACYTVGAQMGLLALSVRYRVNAASAR